MRHVLSDTGADVTMPAADQRVLEDPGYFPEVVSGPFHDGLSVVFGAAALMAGVAGFVSMSHARRGARNPSAGHPNHVRKPAPITSSALAPET
jgi:hypothetical protein